MNPSLGVSLRPARAVVLAPPLGRTVPNHSSSVWSGSSTRGCFTAFPSLPNAGRDGAPSHRRPDRDPAPGGPRPQQRRKQSGKVGRGCHALPGPSRDGQSPPREKMGRGARCLLETAAWSRVSPRAWSGLSHRPRQCWTVPEPSLRCSGTPMALHSDVLWALKHPHSTVT